MKIDVKVDDVKNRPFVVVDVVDSDLYTSINHKIGTLVLPSSIKRFCEEHSFMYQFAMSKDYYITSIHTLSLNNIPLMVSVSHKTKPIKDWREFDSPIKVPKKLKLRRGRYYNGKE